MTRPSIVADCMIVVIRIYILNIFFITSVVVSITKVWTDGGTHFSLLLHSGRTRCWSFSQGRYRVMLARFKIFLYINNGENISINSLYALCRLILIKLFRFWRRITNVYSITYQLLTCHTYLQSLRAALGKTHKIKKVFFSGQPN